MNTPIPMPVEDWNRLFDERMKLIKEVLGEKAAQYARDGDRMHNFNRALVASSGRHKSREAAMFGMALKHWVSILDILDLVDAGDEPTIAFVREKFGDMINYLIMQEASIIQTIQVKQNQITEELSSNKGYAYGFDTKAVPIPSAPNNIDAVYEQELQDRAVCLEGSCSKALLASIDKETGNLHRNFEL